MGRKLDILVPHYKEGDAVVKVLLDSIQVQQGIDFADIGVIICNDGSDVLLTNFIRSYSFPIEYYVCEHRGVSATRNALLDYSNAEYVMYCDADDCFIDGLGLFKVLGELEAEHPDSVFSAFYEEVRNPETGKPIFVSHEMDSTFVHGKIHRRQFLIDNDIRWDESLTVHEDSYFNIQCQRLAKSLRYCDAPFYLWRYRESSVCRHDSDFVLRTYSKLLNSMTKLLDKLLERGRRDVASEYATATFFDAYFTLNCEKWIDAINQEYREEVERRFAQFYRDYESLEKETDEGLRLGIAKNIRNRFYDQGLLSESITYDDWIKHIKDTYGGT